MATQTASLSISLQPDASHSYVAIASAAAGLNTFGNYEASLTASDQIEYSMISSGLSVSANGSYSITGSISNQLIPYRRWSSVSAQWQATATAVYYAANVIAIGAGEVGFTGAQPGLVRHYTAAPGAGALSIKNAQQYIGQNAAISTASLSIMLVPDASHSYVALVSPSSGPGFLSASPGLATGSQIEYQEYLRSAGGVSAFRVYLRSDASFYTDSAVPLDVFTFAWRAWQSGSWSNTATATVDLGGQVDVLIPSNSLISFSGAQPALSFGEMRVEIGSGSLSFGGDGQSPDLLRERSDIQPGAGSLVLAGAAPTAPFQKTPLPGAGAISFTGLQPTVNVFNYPILPIGEGQVFPSLQFAGNPVDIAVVGQKDVGVASITFLGHAPNIVVMGRWEETAAYSLTWS